jgi:hypothetical protein
LLVRFALHNSGSPHRRARDSCAEQSAPWCVVRVHQGTAQGFVAGAAYFGPFEVRKSAQSRAASSATPGMESSPAMKSQLAG